MGGQRRKQGQPDPEFILLAGIRSCSLSYFISSHGADSRATGDEAIIEIGAEIISIIPKKPEHIGKELNCSLISSHTYRSGESGEPYTAPHLHGLNLRKDARSLLAYLPTDVFWGVLPDFRNGKLKFIEARFGKPRYGSGELISLYFSEVIP
jgi:hypothetical protein